MAEQIKLTKGKYTIVDDADYDWLSKIGGWSLSPYGYAITDKFINKKRHIIMMHRLIINTPIGMHTDHINGDKLDNRKENLRICSASQNLRNRGKQVNNTSGYKGVCWDKSKNKWMAYIKVNKKRFHLGYFHVKEDAAKAYNEAAKMIHGEFAYYNLIREGI